MHRLAAVLISFASFVAPVRTAAVQQSAVEYDAADYVVQPHVIDKERLATIASGMLLNDSVINHRTQWQASAAATAGDNRDTAIMPDLLYAVGSTVSQAVTRDHVFVSDQRGTYFQIKRARNRRTVRLTVSEPKTMLGLSLQTTLTGECSLVGNPAVATGTQCSYTPALVVDRDRVDPNFFVPTVIIQEGDLGQEIGPDSLLILAQPGFQNVGANGEVVGLDIFLPNIALVPGNARATATDVRRTDAYDETSQGAFSRIRQVLKSNADTSVFARTIHGFPYLHDNASPALGPGLALAGLFLPDLVPDLPGTVDPHSTKINTNLMRAANNSRIPGRSWTIYQAGVGRAGHPRPGSPPPVAWFNNVWLGLSAVTKRDLSRTTRIEPSGVQQTIGAAGNEGGTVDALRLLVENADGSTIVDTALLPSPVENFYLQLYLALFSRDVNVVTKNTLTEKTSWYPHLAYTGNLTGNTYLWRYYAGAIASPREKAYLGSDLTHHVGAWSYHVGGSYYHHQDVDYFSQVSASVARRFDLGRDWSAKIYSDWRYAYDRPSDVNPLVDPPDNYSRAGGNLTYDALLSIDVYHYFKVFDETIDKTPGADARYRLREGLHLKTWLHPGSEVESYGAGIDFQTRRGDRVITATASWNHITYAYGRDVFGNRLQSDQNVFGVALKISR